MFAQIPLPIDPAIGGTAVVGTLIGIAVLVIIWNNRVKLGLVKDPNATPATPAAPTQQTMHAIGDATDPLADLITKIENSPIAKALDIQADQIITDIRLSALVLVRQAIDECPNENDRMVAMGAYTTLVQFVASSSQAKTPSGAVVNDAAYVPVFPAKV